MFSAFRREVEKLVGPRYASLLEEPPAGIADIALPCFSLRSGGKTPDEIAAALAKRFAQKLGKAKLVGGVAHSGPYVNFHVAVSRMAPLLLKEIAARKNSYGAGAAKREKIAIESPGPNTNKPLHLGHLRNMALGSSLANILAFNGYKVSRVDIINDRGVHICKSMLAYRKLGGGAPGKKPDHFVGDFYVLYAKELAERQGAEEELRAMLAAWERGDAATRALWKKMNSWALRGFAETYRRFGMRIDRAYYESDHYADGKRIVLAAAKKGIFKKDEKGNVVADLDSDKRVLLREDGTTLYITQDIALAAKRYRELRMDRMVYVVGAEQVDHFRALFRIFGMLGYPFAKKCYHLAYGMVNLPEGKMKSREGTVVDADNLMDEMHALAEEEIRKRPGAGASKKRAERIALAAIKYYILKFDAAKTITYDPKKSLEFEGDTGPYLLYTYARARSILRKAKKKPRAGRSYSGKEAALVKLLSKFPVAVEKAGRDYKPHYVAGYAYSLAAAFNEYYHDTKVVGTPQEAERAALVAAVAQALRNALALLGIEVLEKM